ncbi:MAG: mannosyltransferase [Rhodospirillales bacterium]|nr:mannosyltransferase [Rhodospirillales bacterium]
MRRLVETYPLAVCLALALAFRLPVALFDNNFVAPDEIMQYLGQAHRLVYHSGPIPWEFQVGLRSWLIPGFLAGPVWLAKALGSSPHAGIVLVKALLCFCSLSIVWSGFQWGWIYHGLRGACIAGGLVAVWPDLWLMAPHALEEALSAYTLVPAAYFASQARQGGATRHVLAAGFLLGLTFVLREQLAPAIAIIGIYLCWRDMRFWLLGVGMACVPVLLAGGLDWLTWGQPFRSFWLNVYLNAVVGISAGTFGAVPATFYPLMLLADGLWSMAAVFVFTLRSTRALRFVVIAALVTIAEHSLIPHKEFRFIFPAIALIVPLVGLGLAASWRHFSSSQRILVGVFLLSGPLLSPLVEINLLMQTTSYQLSNALAQRHPCVVAMDIADSYFIPIMPLFSDTNFTNMPYAPQTDAIIAPKNVGGIPPGFVRQSCVARNRGPFTGRGPQICYWIKRAGWCQETKRPPPFELIFPPAARRFVIRGD